MPLFYLVTIQNKSYTDANFSKKIITFVMLSMLKEKLRGTWFHLNW